MGTLIWHEYSRLISITATICELTLASNVRLQLTWYYHKMLFGLRSLVFSIVNFSGTLLGEL